MSDTDSERGRRLAPRVEARHGLFVFRSPPKPVPCLACRYEVLPTEEAVARVSQEVYRHRLHGIDDRGGLAPERVALTGTVRDEWESN